MECLQLEQRVLYAQGTVEHPAIATTIFNWTVRNGCFLGFGVCNTLWMRDGQVGS
jgi:hypothetical protein